MAQADPNVKYYRQLEGTWKSNDGECIVVLTFTVKITVIYGNSVLEGNYGVIPTGPSVELHPQGKVGRGMPGFVTYRYDPSEDIQLALGDRSLKDGDRICFNIDFAWHDDADRLHFDLSNTITGEKLSYILYREGRVVCDCGQVCTGKFCPNCGKRIIE